MDHDMEGPSGSVYAGEPQRSSVNEVNLAYTSRATASIRFGIAPHYVHLMGAGFMATNKYCLISGSQLERSANVQIHRLNVPSHRNDDLAFTVIQQFLNELNVQQLYSMELVNPFDQSEQFSLVTVLIAVWKFIGNFAELQTSEDSVKAIIWQLMQRNHVEIDGFEQSFNAVIRGNCLVQVRQRENYPDDAEEESMLAIDEKLDMVFVRTNVHSSDFQTRDFVFENTITNFREALQEEERFEEDDIHESINSLSFQMRAYSEARLERRDYEALPIENDCQVALRAIYANEVGDQRVMKGFEVQQGGIILALEKGGFHDGPFLKALAEQIGLQSDSLVTEVKFHLLRFAIGATVPTETTLAAFDECKVAVIALGPEPPSSSEEELDPEDDLMDEPASDHDEPMEGDETFDESELE